MSLRFGIAAAALGLLALAAAVAALVWGVRALDIVPPSRLTIAAGAEGTGYHRIALAYRRSLAEDGIELEILETGGSPENLARLTGDAPPDFALVQGGLEIDPETGLEGLGAVFLEPLLLLHAGALDPVTYPPDWKGLRLAVGAEGSGTRAVFDRLAKLMGLDPARIERVPLSGTAASIALQTGEVDAALFVAPPGAPYLRPLVEREDIRHAEIRHAEALAWRLDHSEIVTIPEYGLDYARETPDRDIELIAFVARLVARPGLHPAAVNRIVRAAGQLHGPGDVVSGEGRFPSVAQVGVPMEPYARDLILHGPSPLEAWLPYWAVAQINAIALLIVPLVLVLLPLFRTGPSLYAWWMQARVYRNYAALAKIERAAEEAARPGDLDPLDRRLAEIDRGLETSEVPPAYRGQAYAARVHVDLVRRRLAERRAALETAG